MVDSLIEGKELLKTIFNCRVLQVKGRLHHAIQNELLDLGERGHYNQMKGSCKIDFQFN